MRETFVGKITKKKLPKNLNFSAFKLRFGGGSHLACYPGRPKAKRGVGKLIRSHPNPTGLEAAVAVLSTIKNTLLNTVLRHHWFHLI